MTKKESKTIESKPKNKRGRPTKYNEEIQAMADKFIENVRELGQLPHIYDLAEYLGVDSDTINNWGKSHPVFFGTIKKLKKLQEKKLMEKGLDNTWNSSMAIFLLKANHGFVDKVVNINVESPESKVEKLLEKMGE